MNDTAIAQTDLSDSLKAGRHLGTTLKRSLAGQSPDAVVLFASPRHDFEGLLGGLHDTCTPRQLVGCSSAGEFTAEKSGEGLACAVAFRSDEIQFATGLGRGLRENRDRAAQSLVGGFAGVASQDGRYRTALVFTDALAGHADELIENLTLLTSGRYQFVGGGSGDDARFHKTHVFHGREAFPDSVAALEILSPKPIGIGVRHGWVPASSPLRVTEARGMKVVSLNSEPAVDVIARHARATSQAFDPKSPMPFFLHNILGIDTGHGHKLRVPLGIEADGSVIVAADIPERAIVHIMKTSGTSPTEAAEQATKDAVSQLAGRKPKVAIFFDCVATRLRLGKEFGVELEAVEKVIRPAPFVGFNTYGQIARCEGQFSGFHNCTAVTCVIPE